MANANQVKECVEGLRKLLLDAEFASGCSNEQDLCQVLSDGEVLCTVLTQLSHGRISNDDGTYSAANSQFMARNNLKFFIQQCQEEFGMQAEDLFEPDDLLTMSNPEKVVNSLQKLLKRPEAPEIRRRQSNLSLGSVLLENVIKEICNHEKALVEKLTMLLRYRQELLGLLSEWSEDFVQVVFSHTEKLYLVHKEFHEKLVALADQGCEQFCLELNNLFREMAPKLEIYKQYFSDLPEANSRMEEEFKKSPVQKNQLTKLETHFNNGQAGLTFRALFDSPIRQTTSYLMLFKRLQEAAEKDFPNAVTPLAEAIAGMKDFLDRANEYKRLGERIAVTKAILAQISDLLTDLTDPILIGLHLADECFKVKTMKNRKLDTQTSMCLLTHKQLIVATKPRKNDIKYTFDFHVPISDILETKRCEKTSGLEIIQINGDTVVLEYQKRSDGLLDKWANLIEETKSLNEPIGWKSNGHRFELKTLQDGLQCSGCKNVFSGSFMQGYSCSHCARQFHLRCLQRFVGVSREVDHGKITRQMSEKLLESRADGTFLIRDSRHGGKAISIKTSTDVKHINIVESNGKCCLGSNTKFFDSLDDLLEFYRENKLSIHFSAIDCPLSEGIPVKL